MLDEIGSNAWLEVDGGIKPNNVAEVVNAGANVIVAGSAIFGGGRTVAQNVADFRHELAPFEQQKDEVDSQKSADTTV